MNAGTGAFDAAFSQMVLGDLAFDFPLFTALEHGYDVEDTRGWRWFCIAGGSHVIVEEMLAKVKTKPIFSSRVIKISPTSDTRPMAVTYTHNKVASSAQSAQFDYVITTLSMATNRLVDMDSTSITDGQREYALILLCRCNQNRPSI